MDNSDMKMIIRKRDIINQSMQTQDQIHLSICIYYATHNTAVTIGVALLREFASISKKDQEVIDSSDLSSMRQSKYSFQGH